MSNFKRLRKREVLKKYSYLEWLKPFTTAKPSFCNIPDEDSRQIKNTKSPNSVDDLSDKNDEKEEKSNDGKKCNSSKKRKNIYQVKVLF